MIIRRASVLHIFNTQLQFMNHYEFKHGLKREE